MRDGPVLKIILPVFRSRFFAVKRVTFQQESNETDASEDSNLGLIEIPHK